MKKVFFASAFVAAVALVSCNEKPASTEADAAKADSLRKDSTDKANAAALELENAAKAEAEAKEKAKADSTRMADSLAKVKGGKPAGGK